jgi:hypothetical protein
MKRRCIACGDEVKTLTTQTWDLPGLASRDIGFAICLNCGCVIQSPSIGPQAMQSYYRGTAVYQHGQEAKKPSDTKIKGIKRHIKALVAVAGSMPKSIFQVGCSDGYTLSAFQQAGAQEVGGIDPSLPNHHVASSVYGITTTADTFETYETKRSYELILLTHVLEHLYDPQSTLLKCNTMQGIGGWLLIEVPLLEKINLCPTGYFSFEHLNYFSEITLMRVLTAAGYAPCYVKKLYDVDLYPVITIIAKKEQYNKPYDKTDYNRARSVIDEYFNLETKRWDRLAIRIKNKLAMGSECYIWGAGIHTSQLLANTDLKNYLIIKGLLDSSPAKWGKKIGEYTCFSPESVTLNSNDNIIISSFASEQQIYKSLMMQYSEAGVRIEKLYDDQQTGG